MRKEIRDALKKFKPQFGNLNHIRALEILDMLKKKELLLEKRRKINQKIKAEIAQIDLTYEERVLIDLLK